MIKKLLLPAFVLVLNLQLAAQTSQDATVPLSTVVSLSAPSITLNWPVATTADVLIKRRIKGQLGSQWTQLLNQNSSTQTSLTDLNVTTGTTYEYHIRTVVNGVTAHGYAHVAVLAPLVDYRGKILVFIDSTTADAVGLELKIFKDAMRGDGWQPIPTKTGPSATVQSIKNQIIAYYDADPANVKAVLLIGNVPVPYSGNAAWDGHGDHAGAWPSDAYYADVNGTWTDVAVNNTTPGRAANVNVPGDGKFDQSYLPTPADLMVGRIDFRHLSATTFGATPIELTKRYLLKSARWRTKQYTVPYRALVDDNFGYFGTEAFAANGYRNAYPIVGAANVSNGDFLADTGGEGYLFGYACGGGTYNSAGGVGNSTDIANDSINVVFSNIFGSYHGDWDYETDPLMPAALASKGAILACSWAGRPQWFMHALASGETIGYCTKETMNAQTNTEYPSNSGRGGAHVALLGDPTTRAIIVAQVPELTFETQCNTLDLKWAASPDTGILGYHIYRATGLDGPYNRLTTDLVNGLTWTDSSPLDTAFYQVRAVRIDQTPGGGIFYNASSGIIRFVVFQQSIDVQVVVSNTLLTCTEPFATLSATSTISPVSFSWSPGLGDPGPSGTVTTPGEYCVLATNTLNGCTATACITIAAMTDTPVIQAAVTNETSPGASNGAITLTILLPSGSTNATFEWSNGATTQNISALTAGTYTVTVTAENGCEAIQTIVLGTVSGIEDLDAGIAVTIAPNPATNFTKVTLSTEQPSGLTLQLYDVNGKLISTQSGGILAAHTFIVDTSQLPDGFYTLSFSLGEKRLVRKLIVCNSEK